MFDVRTVVASMQSYRGGIPKPFGDHGVSQSSCTSLYVLPLYRPYVSFSVGRRNINLAPWERIDELHDIAGPSTVAPKTLPAKSHA